MLDRKELSKILKVSIQTIDNLRKKGLPYKKIGNSIRFVKEDVLKWIDEQNEKGIL